MDYFCQKMSSSSAFCQNFSFTAHLLPYPRQTLFFLSPSCSFLCQWWFLISSHSLNTPVACCCLLFSPGWPWERPQKSHRLSASHSGVCLKGMVVWWSWSDGHLKTRPCIEGLDREKGRMRALQQHVLPLINGHLEWRPKVMKHEIRLL